MRRGRHGQRQAMLVAGVEHQPEILDEDFHRRQRPKSWFTVFTSEPMPGASPRRNTVAEVAARIDSAAAKALADPEAMKVSSPDSARARPPDIGASKSSWPDRASRSPSALAKAGGTVAHCMTRPPLRSFATAPPSPNSTVSTCCALTTATTSASADAAACAGVAASVPPAAAKASRAGALGSTPVTLWPPFNRFFAMPRPIEPRPTKATRGVLLSAMDQALMPYFAAQPSPAPVVVLGLYSRPT